jgi:hypothetical protein
MVDIIYRTNNPPLWTGPGLRLTSTQADQNMHNLKVAIEALEADRPQPDNIASINSNDLAWVVSFDSGAQITVPVPVLQWRWRGVWLPLTLYQAFDGFMVEGVGLFSVLQTHTSEAAFNKDRLIGGQPVYNAIYLDGTAANASIIYDMGFFYASPLSEAMSVLWELPAARSIVLPAAGGHFAKLRTMATTAVQVLPILHQDIQIGEITFAIGNEIGGIDIPADVAIGAGEMIGIGKPPLADATAARLSLMFAARRVV